MCLQILVKFCSFVLKILSRNKIERSALQNDQITEGQDKFSIAPLFQSRAIFYALVGLLVSEERSLKMVDRRMCGCQSGIL